MGGATRRPGYNFTIKFDKQETASIDIDGIKSCMMYMKGENAYGRSWVLLKTTQTCEPHRQAHDLRFHPCSQRKVDSFDFRVERKEPQQ